MKMTSLATALTAAVLSIHLAAPTAAADESRASENASGRVKVLALQVPLADLDPTTERGAKALYRRILLAAERVCMPALESRNGLRATRDAEQHAAQCFAKAVDAAVAEVRAMANIDLEQLAGVDRSADARLSDVR